jgi:3-isopropylmalate dehydrogenase
MANKYPIAVFPGDGHGPDVFRAACHVLGAVADRFGFHLDFTEYPYGGNHYVKTGELLPDATLRGLKEYRAILFGGVAHPQAEAGLLAREILMRIARHLDLFISLRPVHLYPGVKSLLRDKGPKQIDYILVRENSGGMNGQVGGCLLKGTPNEIAQESMTYTRFQVDRCLRFAFQVASRPDRRGKLTLSGKSSLLPHVFDLWLRAFGEMGEKEFPHIRRDYHGVDDICMHLVKQPESFDVIVAGNLFGDILADIGAVTQGGIGYAAVGSIHPGKTSMFGPMRAGADLYEVTPGQANPCAAFGAAAMLLRHLGEHPAAAALEDAILVTTATTVTGEGALLSRFSTREVADLVAGRI